MTAQLCVYDAMCSLTYLCVVRPSFSAHLFVSAMLCTYQHNSVMKIKLNGFDWCVPRTHTCMYAYMYAHNSSWWKCHTHLVVVNYTSG